MDPSPSSSSRSSMAVPAKIFVGGITKELEDDALKEYFERYGDVKEVVVVKERATGNVKGYGFVEFVDAEAAERAINEEGQHLIRDKLLEVKRARSRSEERRHYQYACHQSSVQSTNKTNNDHHNITSKKIFVGGLPSNVTEDEFRNYFEKFGSVNDVVIMNDSETHRPRGFGFITFDSEEAVQKTMQKRFHELNKKVVEVKIAVPKDNQHTSGSSHNKMNNNSSPGWDRLNSYVNYLPWGYPPYGPEYGYYYGYESQLVPCYGFGPVGYEGGYTYEGYSAIGYGAPYSSPMFTWNEHALMTVRHISVPYRDATFYPGYVNSGPSGYMRMPSGGYNGAMCLGKGKINQTGGHLRIKELANAVSLELDNVKIDDAQ
ncbi:hypothetical protein KFK09_014494 [Dendrobium nobile]|uniref:RRM domain-containing protein n=1 Tax=Dendrobium nobile TaxID=94219 RepID=A0A8T3B2A9_DENNO|nr:hypothetical protein KFK09_014494 [Dendrobium nobile]